jgi:hypothetical protein
MPAAGRQAGGSAVRLRAGGLNVRLMFSIYVVVIVAGLTLYFVVGALNV